LSTQASTKVYRNPNSRPCGHHLRAQLERGSFLAVIPDPVQAFMGSRYRQQQEFSLAPNSGLVLVDWLCSGRAARGERWAFCRFQSRNEIILDGSRVLLDSLMLDPADGPLGDSYRLGRFNCLALVLLVGDPLHAASTVLLEDFAHRPVARHASLVSSASLIKQGVLLRLAGDQSEHVAAEVRRHLAFVADFLGDSPWLRKF
jgi:urease accessory protein